MARYETEMVLDATMVEHFNIASDTDSPRGPRVHTGVSMGSPHGSGGRRILHSAAFIASALALAGLAALAITLGGLGANTRTEPLGWDSERTAFLALAAAPSCSVPMAGMSNGGKHLQKVQVNVATECCSKCLELPGCAGYTFRYKGITNECWLKSEVDAATEMDALATSGYVSNNPAKLTGSLSSFSSSTNLPQRWEEDTTRSPQHRKKCSKPAKGMSNAGSLLKEVDAAGHEACCGKCLEEGAKCEGYTWVHALQQCQLMASVEEPHPHLFYNTLCASVV